MVCSTSRPRDVSAHEFGSPLAPNWRYHAGMPSVQIKNVPADVHAVLGQRAAAAGQSLQEYLLGRLVADARHPTLDELLTRTSRRTGGSTRLTYATSVVRADRDAA
jgi:antitoxin FitA